MAGMFEVVAVLALLAIDAPRGSFTSPTAWKVTKNLDVYELLRGTPMDTGGYGFTVSPDEQWVVTVRYVMTENPDHIDARNQLVVFSRLTGRAWEHELEIRHGIRWYPNCFSADGRRLFLGELVAVLSKDMSAVKFEADADSVRQDRFGTFVGLYRPEERSGRMVPSRWVLSQEEGGEVVRSLDGFALAAPRIGLRVEWPGA